jgi:ethanolamine phosphate phosphodiesterase
LSSHVNLLFSVLRYSLLPCTEQRTFGSFILSAPEWQVAAEMPPPYSTRSFRDHFVEPPSILERMIAGLPGELASQMQRLWDRQSYASTSTVTSKIPRPLRQMERNWHPRRLLNLPNLLVAVWLLLLLWGERWVFQNSLKACEWRNWERWVSSTSKPHLRDKADD